MLLDVASFVAVGSRRLFSWLAVQTAPVVDAGARLPEKVPRPPQNTVYKRIDLNHVSVRDFGRHGQDLDRVCEDIREDLCGEHGIAEIDRRIHSAHAVWSGGVLQLWVCCRTARELPHRGDLPRRLAARARWLRREQPPAPTAARRRLAAATAACRRPPPLRELSGECRKSFGSPARRRSRASHGAVPGARHCVALRRHPLVVIVIYNELEIGETLEEPVPVAVQHRAVLVVLRPHLVRHRVGPLP